MIRSTKNMANPTSATVARTSRTTAGTFSNASNASLLTVNGKGILKQVAICNSTASNATARILIDGVEYFGAGTQFGGNSSTWLVADITRTLITAGGEAFLNIPFNTSFEIQGYISSGGTGGYGVSYELE